jgi:hypothetical protein
VQFVACISEALRAIFIKTMQQAVRPEGFNLAETLQLLCLSNAVVLLSMSAIFEVRQMHGTGDGMQPMMLVITAFSSVLTDLTCFLSLQVCGCCVCDISFNYSFMHCMLEDIHGQCTPAWLLSFCVAWWCSLVETPKKRLWNCWLL